METWYVGCFYLISLNLEICVLFHFSWLISLEACQICWKISQFWFHWFSVLISYFQFDWFLLIVSFSSTYFGVNLLLVFPVVMYGCESWTVKKAECQRIDAFEPWCWRRLLRVPWTARRSNQSIRKEISPGCSLEGMMLKLKLQYFGRLIQTADSLEKTLMLGKIEGPRRRG